MLEGPYWIAEIEPRLAEYKAKVLITVLSCTGSGLFIPLKQGTKFLVEFLSNSRTILW